jgi:MSHA biogenesis protein MshJ
MNMWMVRLTNKFENSNIQTRVMVLVLMVVCFYIFWNAIVNATLVSLTINLDAKKRALKQEVNDIESQVKNASDLIKSNPGLELTKQIEDAKKRSVLLDVAIQGKTEKMVSPRDMGKIVGYVIQKTENLTLKDMKSLPIETLVESDTSRKETDKKNPIKTNSNIFKHGLSINLSGGYFETLSFLKELERHRINMVWDEISYEVKKYPIADIQILMHTLSLSEGWIGV